MYFEGVVQYLGLATLAWHNATILPHRIIMCIVGCMRTIQQWTMVAIRYGD